MPEQEPYQQPYSLTDIEQYLQGKLSPAKMHELEKAALQDPFLADAIDGYRLADIPDARKDLAAVYQQLAGSGSTQATTVAIQKKTNLSLRVAAVLILLAGVGATSWYFLNSGSPDAKMEIAKKIDLSKKDSLVKAPETLMAKTKNNPEPVLAQTKLKSAGNKSAPVAVAPKPADTNSNLVAATGITAELKVMPKSDSNALKDNAMTASVNKEALQEVVITGEGTKKARATNAFVGRIKSDTVSTSVTTMASPPLEGKLPGVTVVGYGVSKKKDLTGSATTASDSLKAGIQEPAPIAPRTGWTAFRQYIFQQLGSDSSTLKNAGEIKMELTLNATGQPGKAKILKNTSKRIHKKLVKALLAGPAWERKDRQSTESAFTVIVRF